MVGPELLGPMTQTAKREDVRFRGKAETLESLMPFVTTARVLGMVLFHVNDWLENPTEDFARISAAPWANADTPLIVRSAAAIEDRPNNSLAGHFVSIGNVTFDKLSGNRSGREIIRRFVFAG